MKIINNSIRSIAIILLLYSCDGEHKEGDSHNHGDITSQHSAEYGHNHDTQGDTPTGHDEHSHGAGEIHMTNEQIKTMNIQFGDFSEIKINDYIDATGTLGLPPNAVNSISTKSSGFIKNSNKYVEGSYVKKGVVMAYLENPEFIQHQREYLEVSAALVFDQQELSRHNTLLEANAGIEKNVQRLQAGVNMKTASIKAITKQLAYMGINVTNLSPDNIVESVPIYAPMSGYITSIKMHNGMYVTPELELMEIVNENHLHLELDVFEKDISNIKEGQKISYTVPALGRDVFEGEVHVIGKEFNTQNKTIRIHGHLEKERPRFIKDLFVSAKIWLTDHTVKALPEGAIIQDGGSSYIYAATQSTEESEYIFAQIMILPGTSEEGFTSVKLIDDIPTGMNIVTEGAYYVYAQSKAGELEHEH